MAINQEANLKLEEVLLEGLDDREFISRFATPVDNTQSEFYHIPGTNLIIRGNIIYKVDIVEDLNGVSCSAKPFYEYGLGDITYNGSVNLPKYTTIHTVNVRNKENLEDAIEKLDFKELTEIVTQYVLSTKCGSFSNKSNSSIYRDNSLPVGVSDFEYVSSYGAPSSIYSTMSIIHIPGTKLFIMSSGTPGVAVLDYRSAMVNTNPVWLLVTPENDSSSSSSSTENTIPVFRVIRSLHENYIQAQQPVSRIVVRSQIPIYTLSVSKVWETMLETDSDDGLLWEVFKSIRNKTGYTGDFHHPFNHTHLNGMNGGTPYSSHLDYMQLLHHSKMNETYGSMYNQGNFYQPNGFGQHGQPHGYQYTAFKEYLSKNISDRMRNKESSEGSDGSSQRKDYYTTLSNKDIALESLKKLTTIEKLLRELSDKVSTPVESGIGTVTPRFGKQDYESIRFQVTEYMALINTIRDVVNENDPIATGLLKENLKDEPEMSLILDQYLNEKQ